jgi:tRNA U34 5-carboxymethylaminomethyl modifying GTPase MnmE/TrmE
MDIVASTIRGFSFAIMEIIGEIPDKEVIENIFKNFCVGK